MSYDYNLSNGVDKTLTEKQFGTPELLTKCIIAAAEKALAQGFELHPLKDGFSTPGRQQSPEEGFRHGFEATKGNKVYWASYGWCEEGDEGDAPDWYAAEAWPTAEFNAWLKLIS